MYKVTLQHTSVIDGDPMLGNLADNGGKVKTVSISETSSAKNAGVYVKGVKTDNSYTASNVYYSTNNDINAQWYRASDGAEVTPPGTADNLIAKDARGYGRLGRPDIGAFKVEGVGP